MNISQLLEALKNPGVSLTISEKLIAGLGVALLSMTVVFIVLVVIAGIISLLQREKKTVKANDFDINTVAISEANELSKNKQNENEDMAALVSVITAAICAATGKSSNNIVVRKIERSNNSKTSWESMSKKL